MPENNENDLFWGQNLDDMLRVRLDAARNAVCDPGVDCDDVEAVAAEHRIEEVRLRPDDTSVSTLPVTLDAADFPNTWASLKRQSCPVPGYRVTYRVPFDGSSFLLKHRPQTFPTIPLRAGVEDGELLFGVNCLRESEIVATRADFDDFVATVRSCLQSANVRVSWFNGRVDSIVAERSRVEQQTRALGFQTPTRRSEMKRPSTRSTKRHQPNVGSEVIQNGFPYDVAVTYAGEDREYVCGVANALIERGVRVFYDDLEKPELWGKNLLDHLAHVYTKQCRFILMFVSRYYIRKPWPTHERVHAQARAMFNREECVLPVRLDDAEIPGMPSTVSYVDARRTDVPELVQLVLGKLGRS